MLGPQPATTFPSMDTTSDQPASYWLLSDLNDISERASAALIARAGKHQARIFALLSLNPGSDDIGNVGHLSPNSNGSADCREALSIAALKAAANGWFEHVEFLFGNLFGNGLRFFNEPHVSQDVHPSSPCAMAWAWSELDSAEATLARSMPPELLCRWLAGSFSFPEDGLLLVDPSPRIAASHETILSFDHDGRALRRAMRAKFLARFIKNARETLGEKRLALSFLAALSLVGETNPSLALAATCASHALSPLGWRSWASRLISAPKRAASNLFDAFGILIASNIFRANANNNKSRAQDRQNTEAALILASECYPGLALAGAFSTWLQAEPISTDALYAPLELAGLGEASALACPVSLDAPVDIVGGLKILKTPHVVGGPNMTKNQLFLALASRIEEAAISSATEMPSSPSRKAPRLRL